MVLDGASVGDTMTMPLLTMKILRVVSNRMLECVHCTTQPEFEFGVGSDLQLQLVCCSYLLYCVHVFFKTRFGVQDSEV